MRNDTLQRNWTIRPLIPDDVGPFRELYRVLHGFSRPQEYDNWFFHENIHGFPIGMVAMADSHLVGVYMLSQVELSLGDLRLKGAQSVDTMTHPDFRNQGIFVALATATMDLAAKQGIEILYGLPNDNSYHGFVRRLGWTHTGNLRRWLRVLAPDQLFKLPRILGAGLKSVALSLPPLALGSYDLQISSNIDQALMPFLERPSCSRQNCMVSRTQPWMHWRYAKATNMNYEWITAWRDGQCKAVASWGMRTAAWQQGENGRAKIAEIFGDSPATAALVVAHAAKRAAMRGATMIETISTSRFTDQVMRRAWFVPHGRPPLIVKRLGESQAIPFDVYEHAGWSLRGGDSDTY